jgi:hypothetical protein
MPILCLVPFALRDALLWQFLRHSKPILAAIRGVAYARKCAGSRPDRICETVRQHHLYSDGESAADHSGTSDVHRDTIWLSSSSRIL